MSREPLEVMYSPAEVARLLGCTVWQVNALVQLGLRHPRTLHPTRGGLWPTFRPSHKCRRIPRRAIEAHLRHMARVAGEPDPGPLMVEGAA